MPNINIYLSKPTRVGTVEYDLHVELVAEKMQQSVFISVDIKFSRYGQGFEVTV
jgi:hypothetical protein